MLSGKGTLRIGPLRFAVRAGHFAAFPPGPSPHHFIAEGDEPLVFLEGGERRLAEDTFWYPDIRVLVRGGVRVVAFAPAAGEMERTFLELSREARA